jgi:hypothetical protein
MSSSGSDGRSQSHADSWDHPTLRLPRLRLDRADGTCRRANHHSAASPQCPHGGLQDVRLSSEASRTTSSSACWGQTQRRSVLGSSPTTSPTSPSRPAETDHWAGGVHGAVHRNVPPWTARPPGRPGDGLHQQPPRDRHRPWVCDVSGDTYHVTPGPHVGVQRLHGLFVEQL